MELTLNNINEYIAGKVPESLHLDYKRLAALKDYKEMAKDVSSFANSDGGVIIYGILESNQIPFELDSDSKSYLNCETLEQVLTSQISPKINNLKIHSIQNPSLNNSIFVIEIPKSGSAPHMAKDNRYYKRYNFQSVAMEHYEIEDVRNRAVSANIQLSLINNTSILINDFYKYDLHVSLENTSNTLVLYYSIRVFIPITWIVNLAAWQFENNDNPITDSLNGKLYWCWSKNFLPPSSMPLWKNKRFTLGKKLEIQIPKEEVSHFYFLVSCPDSNEKLIQFQPKIEDGRLTWHELENI